jgi:multicomponent Na+:H+ antiporter subunit F
MAQWKNSFIGWRVDVSDVYIAVAIAEIALGAPLLLRLALGPSVSDRVVALNTLSTQATLSLMYFAAFADRTIYLDVALWLASFSYLGTFVWARYLERGLL